MHRTIFLKLSAGLASEHQKNTYTQQFQSHARWEVLQSMRVIYLITRRNPRRDRNLSPNPT